MTFSEVALRLRYTPAQPLMVAYGLGVDSTAVLVELARRCRAGDWAYRPDAILFADVGDEKPETYEYLPVMQAYLESMGLPLVHVVRYEPKFARYHTLFENCIVNKTLPSLAFGYKKCSLKFKRQPQDKWARHWEPARAAWKAGMKVIKAIGYDAGPKDMRRGNILDDAQYTYWYPLRELGWDRDRCIEEIEREGLPVPVKSACFFCPSMKPEEVVDLCRRHPHLGRKIVELEDNAAANNTTIEGLWRTSTRKRPGSIARFIREHGLLPEYGEGEVVGPGDGPADREPDVVRLGVSDTRHADAPAVREAGPGHGKDECAVAEGPGCLCDGGCGADG